MPARRILVEHIDIVHLSEFSTGYDRQWSIMGIIPVRRICFDTQVVSRIASESTAFRARFWKRIKRDHHYVISPLTMFELLFGLAGSDSRKFAQHQERFRVLSGNGRAIILTFPEHFAIRKSIGLDIPQEYHTPEECTRYIKLVLKARSKDAIETGQVRMGDTDRKRGWGVNLVEMLHARQDIIQDHVELLISVRTGEQPIPAALDWAKSVLFKSGVPVLEITHERAERFLIGTSAVYEYDHWLWQQAVKGNYQFDSSKHEGDLMDSMQLFYLADPKMFMLSGDKHLRRRIQSTRMAQQVLAFENLVATV